MGFMPVGAQVVHSSHDASKGLFSGVFSLGQLLPFCLKAGSSLYHPLASFRPLVDSLLLMCVCSDCFVNHTLHGYYVIFWVFLGPYVFYPV